LKVFIRASTFLYFVVMMVLLIVAGALIKKINMISKSHQMKA
jgi:hypothetical protein